MTREYGQKVQCPNCKHWHTVETAFNRWLRNHPRFDSVSVGIMRFDCDMLLHRYKDDQDGMGSRQLQFLMFVEVKTRNADMLDGQRDTLGLLDQFLRNRRRNVHGSPKRRQLAGTVSVAWSHCKKKKICVHAFGGHLLQFSGDGPADSQEIKWDRKRITSDQLIGLLSFKLDPDNLRPMDTRRRYKATKTLTGYECPQCFRELSHPAYHCPHCGDHHLLFTDCPTLS